MHALDEDVRLMLAFCEGDAAAFDALFHRWATPLLRYLERMLRDAGGGGGAGPGGVPACASCPLELPARRPLLDLALPDRDEPRAERAAPAAAARAAREPRGRGGRRARVGCASRATSSRRRAATSRRSSARLAAIPERQRAALWLVAVEGRAYTEVAAALEISEPAVKALVHRARVSLAEQLVAPTRDPGEEAS